MPNSRSLPNGNEQSNSDFQKGFAAGYVYSTIESHIDTIGATSGGKITAGEFAGWVAKLLLSKTSGGVVDSSKHLPQVWASASERYALSSAEAQVYVRARDERTLKRKRRISPEGRARIAAAQRKRWKLRTKKKAYARGWGNMTAEERSKEMLRRREVSRQKAAAAQAAAAA